MRRKVPKQYLEIAGKTVIEHAMEAFLEHDMIDGVVAVTPPGDPRWIDIAPEHPKFIGRFDGGAERSDSVINGLEGLKPQAKADDWVLIHDAARPCISARLLDRLIKKVLRHPVGGILGLPVNDTIKRTDVTGGIMETVSRENIWRAQTPQMFRFQVLYDALRDIRSRGGSVTDDAAAMEFLGMRPLMVVSDSSNIKITNPSDIPLAEYFVEAEQKARRRAAKASLTRRLRAKLSGESPAAAKRPTKKAGREMLEAPQISDE